MTTQNKISSPLPIVEERKFSWTLALIILVVGIALGVVASNLVAMVDNIEVSAAPQRVARREFAPRADLADLEMQAYLAREQARQTEAARYGSMGLYYKAGDEAAAQSAITAESARYSGLVEYYKAQPGSETRVLEHDREYGLAAFGSAAIETHPLAWPPRPVQFKPAEDTLAAYHQSEWGLILNKADVKGDIGLMEFPSIGK